MGGHFSKKEYEKAIREADNNREIEEKFRKIAQEKILPNEGFEDIETPGKTQSVPFDFIAMKDRKLALIEMKGSQDDFRYSKKDQYSRLLKVKEALEEDKTKQIKPSLFLLQINLEYGVYQILTKQFYDLIFQEIKEMIKKQPDLGSKQTIQPSLDAIDEYRKKYKL